MDNARLLLAQAKQGQLSSQDLERVALEVCNLASDADTYTLLEVIGYAGDLGYRKVVEKVLNRKDDPFLVRLALQILCREWKLTGDYLEALRSFMDRASWDEAGYVRSIAISEAGEYLRLNTELQLLSKLLTIAKNEEETPDDRKSAIVALSRAMGKSWAEILGLSMPSGAPPADERFTLQLAEQRLARKGGEEVIADPRIGPRK